MMNLVGKSREVKKDVGNDLTPSKLFTVPTRSFGGYIGGSSKSLSCCNSVGKIPNDSEGYK